MIVTVIGLGLYRVYTLKLVRSYCSEIVNYTMHHRIISLFKFTGSACLDNRGCTIKSLFNFEN